MLFQTVIEIVIGFRIRKMPPQLPKHCYIIGQHHFYDLNVFFDPQNLGIDTKIFEFKLIVIKLWPFKGFGGHLGRHLEKNAFPGVLLW